MSAVGIAGDGQVKSSSRKVRAIRAAIASMTSRRRVTATPRSRFGGVSVRPRLGPVARRLEELTETVCYQNSQLSRAFADIRLHRSHGGRYDGEL